MRSRALAQGLTLVIFPPLKLAKRLSESVRTLDVRWMVNRLLAGTFFLHLRGRGEEELLACAEDCCPHKVSSRTLGPAFF